MEEPLDALDKPALRRRLRAVRDGIPAPRRAEWSADIAARLLAGPEVAAAGSVFCYVSIGSEVETPALIAALLATGRRVAIPRITRPGAMVAQPIASSDGLVPGRFGILAPPADGPPLDSPDLAIVPGLAFTPAGDRLGMGAGFYDRWLAGRPAVTAVGLCFPPLLVDHLPVEMHDIRVTRVVTPGPEVGL